MKRALFPMLSLTAAGLLLAGGLGVAKPSGGSHGGPKSKTCDPTAVTSAEESIAAACPCAGPVGTTPTPWKNHGQYVRCVAHATKDAGRAAGLKHRCLNTVVRCGAQSTCGRSNDVVACRTSSVGTCVSGMCSNDATKTCTTDADCTVASCMLTSAAACAGTVGTGSCCSASPSGAFLE